MPILETVIQDFWFVLPSSHKYYCTIGKIPYTMVMAIATAKRMRETRVGKTEPRELLWYRDTADAFHFDVLIKFGI